MTRAAAIYARAYPDEGDIEQQVKVCEAYASGHDLTVAEHHYTTEIRPDTLHPFDSDHFWQLVKAARRREFAVLLVFRLDRVSEKPHWVEEVRSELDPCGVQIIALDDSPAPTFWERLHRRWKGQG